MKFMNDGALLHFNIDVKPYLNDKYPERWVGQEVPLRRPQDHLL